MARKKKSPWEELRDSLSFTASNVGNKLGSAWSNVTDTANTFKQSFDRDYNNWSNAQSAKQDRNRISANNLIRDFNNTTNRVSTQLRDSGKAWQNYFDPKKDTHAKPGIQNFWTSTPVRLTNTTLNTADDVSRTVLGIPNWINKAQQSALKAAPAGWEGVKGSLKTSAGYQLDRFGNQILNTDISPQGIMENAQPFIPSMNQNPYTIRQLLQKFGYNPTNPFESASDEFIKAGEVDFQEASAYMKEAFPELQVDDRTFMQKIKDPNWVGANYGQTMPNLLASLGITTGVTYATKNPQLGMMAGFGSAFTLESGNAYHEAKQFGATDEQATKIADIVGVVNGVLEMVPISRAVENTGAGKQIKRNIVRELTQRVAMQVLEEGPTEGIQEMWSNIMAKAYYDPERSIFAGVPESAFIGGLMGGGTGGVTSVGGVALEAAAPGSGSFIQQEEPGVNIEDPGAPQNPQYKIKQPLSVVDQAYADTIANGGVTIDVKGNKPNEGFSYSPFPEREQIVPKDQFTAANVDNFVDSNMDLLAQPGNHVGMWEEDGQIYMDISQVGAPTVETLQAALDAKQLAAFDLASLEGGWDGNIELANNDQGVYTPLYEATSHPYFNRGQNSSSDQGTNQEGVPAVSDQTTTEAEQVTSDQQASQFIKDEIDQVVNDTGDQIVDRGEISNAPVQENPFDTDLETIRVQLKSMLSDNDLQVLGVEEIFDENGRPAWGKLENNVIYLAMQDGKVQSKTAYHEAMHQYVNKNADPELFRAAVNEYVQKHKVSKQHAQELLADDFANYVAGRQTFSGQVQAYFADLAVKLREFFGRVSSAEMLLQHAYQNKQGQGVITQGGSYKRKVTLLKGKALDDQVTGLYQVLQTAKTPQDAIKLVNALDQDAVSGNVAFQALKKALRQYKSDLTTGKGLPRAPENDNVIAAIDPILNMPIEEANARRPIGQREEQPSATEVAAEQAARTNATETATGAVSQSVDPEGTAPPIMQRPQQPEGLKSNLATMDTATLLKRAKKGGKYQDAYNAELEYRGLDPNAPDIKERGFVESIRQNETNREKVREEVKGTYLGTTDEERIEYGRNYYKENPSVAENRVKDPKEPLTEELVAIHAAIQEDYTTRADQLEKDGNREEAFAVDEQLTEIDNTMAEKLTPVARILQFAHIFSNKSPQAMVRWAERLYAEANETKNLSPVRLAQKLTGKDWEKTVSDDMKKHILVEMRKIKQIKDPLQKQQATQDLMRDVAKDIPPSILQYTAAYRYQNMLINPRTQLRNVYYNMFNMTLLRPATVGVKGGIDMALGKDGSPADALRYYRGLFGGVSPAITEMLHAFKGETPQNPKITEALGLGSSSYQAITQQNLPVWVSIASRGMEAGDRVFVELIANAERDILLSQGKTVEEADAQAYETAAKYLYRQKLDPANITGQGSLLSQIDNITELIIRGRNKVGPLGWFVPFVRVPMAVAKMSIEYNPITGPATMYKNQHKSEQLAKMAVSMPFFIAGSLAAAAGNATWAPPMDEEERKRFYDTGRRPYSIKITNDPAFSWLNKLPGIYVDKEGNSWIPMQYAGPLAINFAIPAALNYYHNEIPKKGSTSAPEKVGLAALGLFSYWTETTPLSNLQGFFQVATGNIDYSTGTQLGFTAGQLMPFNGLVTYIAQIIDPIYRKKDTSSTWSGFRDQLKSGLPWLSEELEPIKGSTGEPAERNLSAYILPETIGIDQPEFENSFRLRQEELQTNAEKNALEKEKTKARDEQKEALDTRTKEEKIADMEAKSRENIAKNNLKIGSYEEGEVVDGEIGDFQYEPGKFQWLDEDGTYHSLDFNKYKEEHAGIGKYKQQADLYTDLRKMWNAGEKTPEQQEQKRQFFEELGIGWDEVRYDVLANIQPNKVKVDYLLDKFSNMDQETMYERILTGRTESISGDVFITDSVLKDLLDFGVLTDSEYSYFKSLKPDKVNGGLKTTGSGGKKINYSLNVGTPPLPKQSKTSLSSIGGSLPSLSKAVSTALGPSGQSQGISLSDYISTNSIADTYQPGQIQTRLPKYQYTGAKTINQLGRA